jgi:hypothetical protein
MTVCSACRVRTWTRKKTSWNSSTRIRSPETQGWVEAAVKDAPPETRYQFERLGYFCADRFEHAPGRKLVFNRTVTPEGCLEQMTIEPARPLGAGGAPACSPPCLCAMETLIYSSRHMLLLLWVI